MSSLIVAHDLHIMMLEVSLDKVHVPRSSPLEAAIVMQTTVMFRLLDEEWTSLVPQRSDHRAYRGSNREDETFEGGRSLVFSVPEATLERPMEGPLHLQIHVRKELSRYFELEPCQSVGFALLRVEHLFNGIIGELLAEGEDPRHRANERNREPISRSLKGRFKILDENLRDNGAFLDLYARLSYFGKSIVTKIESADAREQLFYLGRGVSPSYLYWARETMLEELQSGCWTTNGRFLSPRRTDLSLSCACHGNRHGDDENRERTVGRAEVNHEGRPVGYDKQPMRTSKETTGKRRDQDKGKTRVEKGLSINGKTENEGAQDERTEESELELKSKMNDKKTAGAKSSGKIQTSANSRLSTKSRENKNDADNAQGNDANPLKAHRNIETRKKKDTAGQSRGRGRSLHGRSGAGTGATGATARRARPSVGECDQPFDACRQAEPVLCYPYESCCTYCPSASSHVACWPRMCLRTGYCEYLHSGGGVYSC